MAMKTKTMMTPEQKMAVEKSFEAALDLIDECPNGQEIVGEMLALMKMLLKKNIAYGDAALNPLRVFSKASLDEQIRVRLDDKISRLARGANSGEDVELDLLGYLVLLRVMRRIEAMAKISAKE
jgi:hypothetical protein